MHQTAVCCYCRHVSMPMFAFMIMHDCAELMFGCISYVWCLFSVETCQAIVTARPHGKCVFQSAVSRMSDRLS